MSKFEHEMDEMKEIINDFLVEADELTSSLDREFIKLESGANDPDLLNEIFRAAHTIKGTSSFLGMDQITLLSHKMEDVLNKLRKKELSLTPYIMDSLLEALDILELLLGNVRDNVKEEIDTSSILEKLTSTMELDKNSSDYGSTSSQGIDQIEKRATEDSSKISTKQTIRVDVERLDSLMNLMGELVLGRNSLTQSISTLNKTHDKDDDLENLKQATSDINFVISELQTSVMQMRMLPIGKVFNRYPRLVRDLARECNKKIELNISGESTELDKSIIEEISDPLVHIIRNSCDHGLETTDERIAKGKSETGTVSLSADRIGSHIVIEISDDGRGLDADAIKSKALMQNLATPEEIEKMSKREIYRFIFEPGFSTAKIVTDVSGRGVGMDVVRTNIEKLNGLIELESELNLGTTITIKLPLTLAIIQGLPIEVDDEIYVLPLSSVQETIKVDISMISFVNQKPMIRLRDEIIPIIDLNALLRKSSKGLSLSNKDYVVIVGIAEKKLGICIDKFMGQEEIVIKSMGEYLGNSKGIAGATILGDGRIRLIVDLSGLFNIAREMVG